MFRLLGDQRGRTLVDVRRSVHEFDNDVPDERSLEVWLTFSDNESVRIRPAPNGLGVVTDGAPWRNYDMGRYGRVKVMDAARHAPFRFFVEQELLEVRPWRSDGDAYGVFLVFPNGRLIFSNLGDELDVVASLDGGIQSTDTTRNPHT